MDSDDLGPRKLIGRYKTDDGMISLVEICRPEQHDPTEIQHRRGWNKEFKEVVEPDFILLQLVFKGKTYEDYRIIADGLYQLMVDKFTEHKIIESPLEEVAQDLRNLEESVNGLPEYLGDNLQLD